VLFVIKSSISDYVLVRLYTMHYSLYDYNNYTVFRKKHSLIEINILD